MRSNLYYTVSTHSLQVSLQVWFCSDVADGSSKNQLHLFQRREANIQSLRPFSLEIDCCVITI